MKKSEALKALGLENCCKKEVFRIILESNLGKENEKIAKLWLIDGMYLADIGAAIGYERSTIGKRLPKILYQIKAVSESTKSRFPTTSS